MLIVALAHKFSNTGAASVGELLQSNEQFLVPRFQRNYSWNREKVETLWNDLVDGYNKIRANPDLTYEIQYLLGPVVLVRNENGPGKYWIIDGQQRLSTLTMIFCVARDIIREMGLNEEIGKINEMIEITHMGKHQDWKIVLNDTDKYLFKEIQAYEDTDEAQIQRIKKRKTRTKSEKLLTDNYVYLYDKIIESLCTDFGNSKMTNTELKNLSENEKTSLISKNIPWLNYFLTHIRENNYLVKIMVNDYNTAFQIFETLNERGQSLSKSNLIKNHVINQMKGEEKQKELSDRWNEIFDLVIGKEQEDDEFIIESFRSRDPLTKISKRDLYKIIKNKTPPSDEKACQNYINELDADSEFITMINPPITSYPDEDTRDDIRAVDALGAKFIRIPILAAYRKWGLNAEYKTLVKFLVKFFFKYRVVRHMHPGDVDKVVAKMTMKILEGESLKDIITEAKTYDDHDDFNYNFKKFMDEPKSSVAKYILQQITLHLGTPDNDVRPIDGLTLEHILPRKYKEKWPESDFLLNTENKMTEFVDRLGNLTLLTNIKNSINQNNTFHEKKETYEKSNLDINLKMVVSYNEWTSKTIEGREAKFCEYADKIWNLDSF